MHHCFNPDVEMQDCLLTSQPGLHDIQSPRQNITNQYRIEVQDVGFSVLEDPGFLPKHSRETISEFRG